MNNMMMNNMHGFAKSSDEKDSTIREKRDTESANDEEEVARQMGNTGHFFGNGPRFYNRWGWRTYDTMYRPFRQQNPFFFSMNQNMRGKRAAGDDMSKMMGGSPFQNQ